MEQQQSWLVLNHTTPMHMCEVNNPMPSTSLRLSWLHYNSYSCNCTQSFSKHVWLPSTKKTCATSFSLDHKLFSFLSGHNYTHAETMSGNYDVARFWSQVLSRMSDNQWNVPSCTLLITSSEMAYCHNCIFLKQCAPRFHSQCYQTCFP